MFLLELTRKVRAPAGFVVDDVSSVLLDTISGGDIVDIDLQKLGFLLERLQ